MKPFKNTLSALFFPVILGLVLLRCQAADKTVPILEPPKVTVWIYPVTTATAQKTYVCGGRISATGIVKPYTTVTSQGELILVEITKALASVGLRRSDIKQVTYLTKAESADLVGIPSALVMTQLRQLDSSQFEKLPNLIDYKSVESVGAETVLIEIEVVAGK